MPSIKHPNVNRLYPLAMQILQREGVLESTRNGGALVHPLPFLTTYSRPWERVLFHRARRANPFFHLFESMWMLAGRADSAFLDTYVGDFGRRFAEPDGTLHGAYGRRWRNWFMAGPDYIDQIEEIVAELKASPSSRQCVLAMWDPVRDLGASVKDKPCNTHVYFRLRPIQGRDDGMHDLVTTVCCRSNDAVWGAYGANAVHFSVLHEYMAWRLGALMGEMVQLSNNMHCYLETAHLYDPKEEDCDHYSRLEVRWTPLFGDMPHNHPLLDDLAIWLDDPQDLEDRLPLKLFAELLVPMARIHTLYKLREWNKAMDAIDLIRPTDWRMAVGRWLDQHRRG